MATSKSRRKFMQVDPIFSIEINQIKMEIVNNKKRFDKLTIPSDREITHKITTSRYWQELKKELCEEKENPFRIKRDRRSMY